MSEKKIHYGVRLRADQLEYLKSVPNPSEWIRKAVDEKRKREEKKRKGEGFSDMREEGRFVVIEAELVPEAEEVEKSKLEEEIHQEVEEVTIPWVKEVLKVTVSDSS